MPKYLPSFLALLFNLGFLAVATGCVAFAFGTDSLSYQILAPFAIFVAVVALVIFLVGVYRLSHRDR